MKRLSLVLLVAAVFLSVPVLAHGPGESVELSPFVGYVFGGELDRDTNNIFDDDVDVDDDAAFGFRIGYRPNSHFMFELSYFHEETTVSDQGGLFEPGTELADLDVDLLEGAFLFHFGGHRFEGFVGPGLGATRLDLAGGGFSDEVKFETSFGGGFKIFFTDNVGFRFDLRHHWTFVDADDRCRHCDDDEILDLTQVAGGVLFSF